MNRLRGRTGPLLTLLAGTGLAAALLVASMVAANGTGPDGAETQLAGAGTPSPSPAPEPQPEPSQQTAAPPAPAEQPPVTYVGWVDGGGASVAIVVTGEQATAYVCDGSRTEAWLHGTARGGYLQLAGDGGRLTARYDAGDASGQASVGGRSWSFTAEQVDQPEGLYRFAGTIAGGAVVRGGWIVLPDGSQVGVLTVDGSPAPAPALEPATGAASIAGYPVTAERQG